MNLILSFKTAVGTFYIGKSDDRQYHPIFNNIDLGSYVNMWEATRDLSINAIANILHPETNKAIDTSTLGIPEDYLKWDRA
jgi:hypothetical protein